MDLHVSLGALHSERVRPVSAALEMSNKMALRSNHISFALDLKILVFNLFKLMNKMETLSQLHFPLKIENRYTYL